MRCKVGDLAFYVGAECPALLGSVVRIVAPSRFEGAWLVEPDIHPRVQGIGVWDYALRPIRPDDAEDEMLRIAGKPQETPREMLESIRRELA